MAAAKAKSGSLDELLEAAEPEPAFVAPVVVEADEPQFHTADAKMTIAPEPVAVGLCAVMAKVTSSASFAATSPSRP